MQLKINGEFQELDLPAQTVAGLLDALKLPATRGMAVAVNDAVVPRSQWSTAELKDKDRVEIIRATQGG